jgi:chromosome segregation ATPase
MGQLQMQQAQRNAEQAEQKARALQAQARVAQTEADRAQENASRLQGSSSQASNDAASARRNLSSMEAFGDINASLSDLSSQIAAVLAPPETSASSAGFINSEGQATGTLINVTA